MIRLIRSFDKEWKSGLVERLFIDLHRGLRKITHLNFYELLLACSNIKISRAFFLSCKTIRKKKHIYPHTDTTFPHMAFSLITNAKQKNVQKYSNTEKKTLTENYFFIFTKFLQSLNVLSMSCPRFLHYWTLPNLFLIKIIH